MSTSYIDDWNQDPPRISNPYLHDTTLQDILETRLPPSLFSDIQEPLTRFGKRCITEIKNLGDEAEKQEPKLHQFDAWQHRIDQIETCHAWQRLHDISAEEAIVSTGYQRKPNKNNPNGFGEYSRIIQFTKLYLFNCNSAIYDCPLAMSDGAARLIEATLHHDRNLPQNVRSVLEEAFDHLTSTDPAHFWTSGQWMTEKRGGSDVSQSTRTIAVPSSSPNASTSHLLYGVKFFTSATDSDMTFTLARIVKDTSDVKDLDKVPLSLFFVRIRDAKTGRLNHIQVHKLKQKLGTKALPTAELSLCGTESLLIGKPGQGIKNISYMLNITRLYNSVGSCSLMRRIMALAQDYARRRYAFGKSLAELPLHTRIIARLETETKACTHLAFDTIDRLGRMEWAELNDNLADNDDNALILRLLVPVAKLYTARQCMSVVTEGIECFGGQGYIEDTGIPVLLRNGHVLPIWEGTTNVLSMDVIRVLQKHKRIMEIFSSQVSKMLAKTTNRVSFLSELDQKRLKFSARSITFALAKLQANLQSVLTRGRDTTSLLEVTARDLAFTLAQVYTAALLYNHVMNNRSSKTNVSLDVQVLYQYIVTHQPLCRFLLEESLDETQPSSDQIINAERMIALDIGGSGEKARGCDQVIFTPSYYQIRSNL